MIPQEKDCSKAMLSIKDALEAVSGNWKLLILYSLCSRPKRFSELKKEVIYISDKTLARELKNLQADKLINRQVHDSTPVVIEYEITDHGRSLNKVLYELWNWGISHRKEVIG